MDKYATILAELTRYLETINSFDKDSAQDGQALNAYAIELTNYMARANYLMADYGKMFRDKKKSAYLTLMASSHASQKYFAPSLGKDFIDAQCADVGHVYDMAERVSRTCVHTLDAIKSITMSLMSERKFNHIPQ